VKSSRGKGLHLHVPVTGGTYARTKEVARALARDLSARRPELVVDRMTRALRPGKVLVDWSQNDPGKSTVAPWSVRAGAVPTVAAPVTWEEVEQAAATADAAPLVTALDGARRRLDAQGDLFAEMLRCRQRL
jgi:bifunctional non-homologous end joining protein LigD